MKLSLFSRNELADSCDLLGWLDPNVYQGIDELRHDLGQLLSIGIRKNVFALMSKFVAGVSAGINHLSDIGRHPFVFLNGVDLFPKQIVRFIAGNLTCFGNVVRELLQADAKKYAGAAGRQIDDALRLDKVFLHAFGHPFGRLDSRGRWVTKFAIFPKDQPVAGLAFGKGSLFYWHDLSDVLHADGLVAEAASAADTREDVISRNWRLNFGNNRQRKNRGNSPAVRAFIGV